MSLKVGGVGVWGAKINPPFAGVKFQMSDPPTKKKEKKRDVFKEVVVPYRVQPLIFSLAHGSCCHCSPFVKLGENKAFFPPLSAPSIFARGFSP